MDKWQEYSTYENWKDSNYHSLYEKYNEQQKNNLNWDSGGAPSFDDFYLGIWQSL